MVNTKTIRDIEDIKDDLKWAEQYFNLSTDHKDIDKAIEYINKFENELKEAI